jgi:hypothetical protein
MAAGVVAEPPSRTSEPISLTYGVPQTTYGVQNNIKPSHRMA